MVFHLKYVNSPLKFPFLNLMFLINIMKINKKNIILFFPEEWGADLINSR